MPDGNGNSNAEPEFIIEDFDDLDEGMVGRIMSRQETLKGDFRDQMLKFIKGMKKPWEQLTGLEQKQTNHELTRLIDRLIDDTFLLVASRGVKYIEGTIEDKFAVERGEGITVRLKLVPASAEIMGELIAVAGLPVICIGRQAGVWKGEEQPFEPDNVAVKGDDGQTSMILPRGNAAGIAEAMAVHSGPAEAQMALQAEGMPEPTIPPAETVAPTEQPTAEQVAATS